MSRSSELMNLPGAVAAGLFSRKGFLDEFEGPFAPDAAAGLGSLCSAITLTMEMQGLLLERISGQPGWTGSPSGWATWGPEKAIVVVGDNMCLLDSPAINDVVSTMRTVALAAHPKGV